jgi:hypothetical protein
MDNQIEYFDPAFFRPCVFPILRELGYGTSVSMNNGLVDSPFSTQMNVSLSVFNNEGMLIKTLEKIMSLDVGEIAKIDTRDYLNELDGIDSENMLGVFHLTPVKWAGESSVIVSARELVSHVSAGDDFIEFRQEPKGVITGVAYQVGQQNDLRFSSTRRTLVQAPKVIVRKNLDTLLALMNVSTRFSYSEKATFDYVLVDPLGNVIAQSSISIPAWTYRLISMHDLLESAGLKESFIAEGGLGMLIGSSEDAGLIPISLTRNLESGAIACDHSLPPVYYLSTWGGKARIKAHNSLVEKFFSKDMKDAKTNGRN